MRKQVYVLPHPQGWAVVTYGDEVIPDDEIVPLPLTSLCSYEDAVSFLHNECADLASGAMVDGWESMDQLRTLEPALYERVTA